jgi:hypothetical protein
MRRLFGFVCIMLSVACLSQTHDLPLHHLGYQFVDRADVVSRSGFSTTIKPFATDQVFRILQPDAGSYMSLQLKDVSYDSTGSKNPIWNTFYQDPADAYYYRDPNLEFFANPVFHFGYGTDNRAPHSTSVNSRGVEIGGKIDNKVSFYSYITENQVFYPEYINDVRDSTLVIPREGFWKQYNETGTDYLRAFGYIDFGLTESISAQLGYGKNFIGNGVRSLVLSDYANYHPYLRINTNTKIFDYTNLYAQHISDVEGGSFGLLGIGAFNQKYTVTHHFNLKLKPNLHIGLFETVVFGDSTGGFKLEYLNPIIFYRSIEQQNGSADNAFIGMDFKWNLFQKIGLYGQLIIDDLIVQNSLEGNGWWGNKQGFQFGVKYFDLLGVENLMLQGEWNRVRPYTYAHKNGFTSYSHYNLAIGHPLGANFTEYLGRATYNLKKWNFESHVLLARYGNDIGDVNYGRDILKDYTERIPDANGLNQEFGNEHLQGILTNLYLLHFRSSYMLRHNLFIDLEATFRRETDELQYIDTRSTIFGISIRLNSQVKTYLF